jgi:hypothetical protein
LPRPEEEARGLIRIYELILGFVNMILVLFQPSTGLRWIKVPFRMHRRTGMILFISAALHGILPYLANCG